MAASSSVIDYLYDSALKAVYMTAQVAGSLTELQQYEIFRNCCMCYATTNARHRDGNTKAALETMYDQLKASGIERLDDVAAYLCKKYNLAAPPPGITPFEFPAIQMTKHQEDRPPKK